MKKSILLAAVMAMAGTWAANAQDNVPVPEVNNFITVYSAALGNAEGYAFDSWGGGAGEQIMIGDKYAYRISNFAYFGSGFAAIDASGMDYLHMDVYPAADMTLAIVPITGSPEKGMERSLTAGQWNSLDFSVADYTEKGANMANVYQIKYVSRVVAEGANGAADGFANGDGTESFIVGNVYFYKEAAQYDDDEAPVITTAQVIDVTSVSATVKLVATDNLSENVYFTATDQNGKEYRRTAAAGQETVLEITGLSSGTDYTLTIVAADEKGNVSDAQVVTFTTTEIPAIPQPVKGETLSLFSPYLGNASGYWFDNWGGGSGAPITIHGLEAYMISNFQWFGSQFGDIDVTDYEIMRLDIYPIQDMTLTLVPITRGAPEKGIQVSLTGNQWNPVELNVQDYIDKGANMMQMWQLKYVSKLAAEGAPGAVDGFANGDGNESFIVGNIYFVNPVSTGVTEINTVKKGFDTLQPVYNVMGQRVGADYKGVVIQDGHKFVR